MCCWPIVSGPIAARNKAVDIYLRGGGALGKNKQPKSLYKAKNGEKKLIIISVVGPPVCRESTAAERSSFLSAPVFPLKSGRPEYSAGPARNKARR
jgi:hypothetical protein